MSRDNGNIECVNCIKTLALLKWLLNKQVDLDWCFMSCLFNNHLRSALIQLTTPDDNNNINNIWDLMTIHVLLTTSISHKIIVDIVVVIRSLFFINNLKEIWNMLLVWYLKLIASILIAYFRLIKKSDHMHTAIGC